MACSDALLLTAQAVGTLKRQSRRKDCLALADICKEKEVHRIVVGKPSHMNGDKSANTEKNRAVCRGIEEDGTANGNRLVGMNDLTTVYGAAAVDGGRCAQRKA